MTNDKLKNFIATGWESILANKKSLNSAKCEIVDGIGKQLQSEVGMKFSNFTITEISITDQKPLLQVAIAKTESGKLVIAGLLCNEDDKYISSESIIFEYNGSISDDIVDQMLARIYVEQFVYMMMELKELSQSEANVMITAISDILTSHEVIRDLVHGCTNRDIIRKTPTCERYVKHIVVVKEEKKVTKIKK